ncbi:hypothetical protein Tco_0988083 [Tanacetum coccineum]|uniref:Integrase, catalytic region, zinc finger, CCHC-type, peptidase aspartic, catalytic n=1 Tax=Tanacetum coccineum TaxID=301880 RepID=A0ABQ5EPY3_9ASTR
MIEENGEMRRKRVLELLAPEKLQYEADVKETNIILQGVPVDVYALYYHKFAQLINDMHIYQMRLQQFQVNTKFLNSLPPEWRKFVTNVKLVKDLHVTNFDHLFAYLEHHEAHASEIRLLKERSNDSGWKSYYSVAASKTKPFGAGSSGTKSTDLAKISLMTNLSHYGLDALAEVNNNDNVDNNLMNQVVQAMSSSEQSSVVNNSETKITNHTPSNRPTKVEDPKELPKVSMVNTSLKKLKHHLASFDVVIKERTTAQQLLMARGKLKGKALVDNVVTKHTIDPEMLKIDVELITPKLLNKRTAHFCNACMVSANHDLYVLDFINNVNARAKSKSVKKSSKRKVWKPTGKVFTNIRYSWRPTGRTFTIVGNACPLTRITTTAKVPLRKPTALEFKFGNDHVAKILGYGDYQIGNVTISRVYYVEGLGHNLFFVGQFCDSNLEVAFRQHTCFIRNLEGVDLLTGS